MNALHANIFIVSNDLVAQTREENMNSDLLVKQLYTVMLWEFHHAL